MIAKYITAVALGLCAITTGHAATYTFATDAYLNSTAQADGAHAAGGALHLNNGDKFTVFTNAAQIWHGGLPGDYYYNYFTSNADGAGSFLAFNLNGAGIVNVGTLVADINGDYRVIGAGTHTFTAWGSGELVFHYADINYSDNSGTVFSTVMTVPEPASYGMLLAGLSLISVCGRRRKR